jgi:hypothetical protein
MAHAHGACNAVGDACAAHAAHAMHAYLLCPVQQGKPVQRTALLAHTQVASCGLSLRNALAMLWYRCGNALLCFNTAMPTCRSCHPARHGSCSWCLPCCRSRSCSTRSLLMPCMPTCYALPNRGANPQDGIACLYTGCLCGLSVRNALAMLWRCCSNAVLMLWQCHANMPLLPSSPPWLVFMSWCLQRCW